MFGLIPNNLNSDNEKTPKVGRKCTHITVQRSRCKAVTKHPQSTFLFSRKRRKFRSRIDLPLVKIKVKAPTRKYTYSGAKHCQIMVKYTFLDCLGRCHCRMIPFLFYFACASIIMHESVSVSVYLWVSHTGVPE